MYKHIPEGEHKERPHGHHNCVKRYPEEDRHTHRETETAEELAQRFGVEFHADKVYDNQQWDIVQPEEQHVVFFSISL
jgi:hypothetical protein